MVKRGSITVFLALILGLILSLLSSGLESARMAAARTQILNGMDIGLYSLFGQYNKSLLKEFRQNRIHYRQRCMYFQLQTSQTYLPRLQNRES